jgi:hypothetical protein
MTFSVAVRDEIKEATWHLRFGLINPIPADYDAWATECERLLYGAAWAIDWIRSGQPEPPEFIKRSLPME